MLYLFDPDLMNLFRREVRGGALLHPKTVVGIAIRQSPDARIVTAPGNVLRFEKLAEANISRRHLPGDRSQQLLLDARLLRGRNRSRKLFERLSERSVFRLLIGDRVHLRQYLLHQISRWLAMVIHADRHVVGDLLKGER